MLLPRHPHPPQPIHHLRIAATATDRPTRAYKIARETKKKNVGDTQRKRIITKESKKIIMHKLGHALVRLTCAGCCSSVRRRGRR